ncbi:hypothetical protein [Rhodanobacter sp. Soil772]|uniref:hypothetical protein n=1 Tax=Rhodanobacter sp. Soil772 TaxID=1736406 RepID=UPI000AC54319|nr:hypothetical protein [Rhodanobacter sp. Soil772]
MDVTLADIQRFANAGSVADQMRFSTFMWKFHKVPYQEWAEQVEGAIRFTIGNMATRRNRLAGLSEDALTEFVTISLSGMGLQAKSATVNGNCDVVISHADYIWIGEAKIFKGVAVVWGGYLQLTNRYSTGLREHNRGGMLLYCYKGTADGLLEEWKAALTVDRPASAASAQVDLMFTSQETCHSSGLPLHIKHFAVPLFHAPDESVKLSRHALAAAKIQAKAG